MRLRTHNGIISIKMHIRAQWDSAHRGSVTVGLLLDVSILITQRLRDLRHEMANITNTTTTLDNLWWQESDTQLPPLKKKKTRVPYEDKKRAQL